MFLQAGSCTMHTDSLGLMIHQHLDAHFSQNGNTIQPQFHKPPRPSWPFPMSCLTVPSHICSANVCAVSSQTVKSHGRFQFQHYATNSRGERLAETCTKDVEFHSNVFDELKINPPFSCFPRAHEVYLDYPCQMPVSTAHTFKSLPIQSCEIVIV